MSFSPEDFFDLSGFAHAAVFDGCENVWDVLGKIAPFVRANVTTEIRGHVEDGAHIIGEVFIDEGTVVEAGAYIRGPAIIGKNCEIRTGRVPARRCADRRPLHRRQRRPNSRTRCCSMAPPRRTTTTAAIRSLGNRTNLGAGQRKLSNYKIAADKTIRLVADGAVIDTGLIKFGAILGDGASTGCNSVLNPGTVLGRNVLVYACTALRGYVPHDTIVKLRQTTESADLR